MRWCKRLGAGRAVTKRNKNPGTRRGSATAKKGARGGKAGVGLRREGKVGEQQT